MGASGGVWERVSLRRPATFSPSHQCLQLLYRYCQCAAALTVLRWLCFVVWCALCVCVVVRCGVLVCAPPPSVCSEGALDRCIEDFTLGENKDFVRKEIALSLRMQKRIVPVLTPGFSWPPRLADVPDICGIQRKNGVPWITEYIHACMEKLLKFLHEPVVVAVPSDASGGGGGAGGGPVGEHVV